MIPSVADFFWRVCCPCCDRINWLLVNRHGEDAAYLADVEGFACWHCKTPTYLKDDQLGPVTPAEWKEAARDFPKGRKHPNPPEDS